MGLIDLELDYGFYSKSTASQLLSSCVSLPYVFYTQPVVYTLIIESLIYEVTNSRNLYERK